MVYALFGNPVAQSLSPLMHNAALKEMGLPGMYTPLCVRNLSLAVQGLRGLDIRGVSVTLPFKTEIMNYLDDVDDEALRIGAVNTLVNRDGRLTGHNTDWRGLIRSMKEQMEVKGKTVVILGCGRNGAGRPLRCCQGWRPSGHHQPDKGKGPGAVPGLGMPLRIS